MASLVVRDRTGLDALLDQHPHIKRGKALSGNYLILNVPDGEVPAALEVLANTKMDAYALVVGLMGAEALDASGITQIQRRPYLDLRGRGVLLGFVDTGIDYTQAAFKYEDGTSKIQYIWDQTAEGPGPGDFGFGTEYNNARINEALLSPDPLSVVPHRDTVGHGTFLASVAGGREEGEYAGAAPDAEIIMVKLRGAGEFYRKAFLIPPEQENAFETPDVMLGCEYILEKADELNRPVAICVSVGTNLEGHDGFTVFEEYLSRIAHETGVALCAAAGNESSTGHHTSGTITKTGDSAEVEINVPEGAGDIYITTVNGAGDKLSVSVLSPGGEMAGRVPPKSGAEVASRLVFEKSTVIVYYFFPVGGSGSQITVVKILAPTPGIWKITLYGDSVINGKYDMWLPITGFVSPGVEFLTPVPDCTVVVPATAAGVITCGAYDTRNRGLYAASGWGPTRLPSIKPDLAAPGVNVTGIYPTGPGAMTGTSAAAAVTAGAAALMLQWGVADGNETFMDTYLIRANLIRGCKRDEGVQYPNNQWGYGRLDLEGAFGVVRVG